MAVLTGDWGEMDRAMKNIDAVQFRKWLNKGLELVLIFYKDQIQRNIDSGGTLAGKPFMKNSEVTIKMKGSSAPLVDTRDMRNSVDYIIKGVLGFVGLKRGDVHLSGKSVVDIGEINENGAVVTLPGGGTVLIPARPFIKPVLDNRQMLMKAQRLFRDFLVKKVIHG